MVSRQKIQLSEIQRALPQGYFGGQSEVKNENILGIINVKIKMKNDNEK